MTSGPARTLDRPEIFIRLPHSWCGASVAGVGEVAAAAEELGFDGVSVQDHILSSSGTSPCGHDHDGDDRSVLEPIATLSFVAARTRRLKLVTGVIVLPFHHVVRLAKSAATLDVLSGGRLILGVGIGWPKSRLADATQRMSRHANLAGRETALFDLTGSRATRMDEALEALHRLWAEEPATLDGDLIRFEGVDMRPLPAQQPHPPIWIGGRVDAVLQRVARWGDAWFPSQASVETIASGRRRLLELAEALDRPAPRSAVNLFASVARDRDGARATMRAALGRRFTGDEALFASTVAGNPTDVVNRVREYTAVGVTALDLKILPLATGATLDQMRLLAEEVLPALAAS